MSECGDCDVPGRMGRLQHYEIARMNSLLVKKKQDTRRLFHVTQKIAFYKCDALDVKSVIVESMGSISIKSKITQVITDGG